MSAHTFCFCVPCNVWHAWKHTTVFYLSTNVSVFYVFCFLKNRPFFVTEDHGRIQVWRWRREGSHDGRKNCVRWIHSVNWIFTDENTRIPCSLFGIKINHDRCRGKKEMGIKRKYFLGYRNSMNLKNPQAWYIPESLPRMSEFSLFRMSS